MVTICNQRYFFFAKEIDLQVFEEKTYIKQYVNMDDVPILSYIETRAREICLMNICSIRCFIVSTGF